MESISSPYSIHIAISICQGIVINYDSHGSRRSWKVSCFAILEERLSHVKVGDKPYEQRELSSSFLMPTEQFGKLVAYTVASTSLRCKRS